LFLLFIIDLPLSDHTASHLQPNNQTFADDIKTYCIIKTLAEAINFQLLIFSIEEWCEMWQLNINSKKSLILHLGKTNQYYSYHILGTTLPAPLLAPDLGVIVNSNLFFTSHISSIVSQARSRCTVFIKSFISRDAKTMLKFFITYTSVHFLNSVVACCPLSLHLI